MRPLTVLPLVMHRIFTLCACARGEVIGRVVVVVVVIVVVVVSTKITKSQKIDA